MLAHVKKRLRALESKIVAKFPLFPGDADAFIEALGFRAGDKKQFERLNPDGSRGYDFVAALSSTAAEDWAEENR